MQGKRTTKGKQTMKRVKLSQIQDNSRILKVGRLNEGRWTNSYYVVADEFSEEDAVAYIAMARKRNPYCAGFAFEIYDVVNSNSFRSAIRSGTAIAAADTRGTNLHIHG